MEALQKLGDSSRGDQHLRISQSEHGGDHQTTVHLQPKKLVVRFVIVVT